MTISAITRFFLAVLAVLALMTAETRAQTASPEPALPAPLKHLADEGAQMRYLGQHGGLDGWIAIKNGVEQYFYVTQKGDAFVMGLLFDQDGKVVTARQVTALQGKEADLDKLTGGTAPEAPKKAPVFKTPAEEMYSNIEDSNWIRLGKDSAPVLYMFIDPQCPYCKAFIGDLRRNYIVNGLVQVRLVPVGLKTETRAQAAFLLAVADPEGTWYRHLDGDETALPVTPGINEQGVERNLSIMQSWKFDATPTTVYRAKDGKVKIVQGRAKDAAALIADLPPAPLSSTPAVGP